MFCFFQRLNNEWVPAMAECAARSDWAAFRNTTTGRPHEFFDHTPTPQQRAGLQKATTSIWIGINGRKRVYRALSARTMINRRMIG